MTDDPGTKFMERDDIFMADLKIFTENIEEEALKQIEMLIAQPAFQDCKIRIMPDVHAGKGCVIGFTADLGDKVIPNIVGVDIGCGMRTVELGKVDIDFEKLDRVIREKIPYGPNVNEEPCIPFNLKELRCCDHLHDIDRLERSCGSLGGGNHFIEIDEDLEGNKYLVIHTGSRNLGKQVADYYQSVAIENLNGKEKLKEATKNLIAKYKEAGREKDISKALLDLKKTFQPSISIPNELCYLKGQWRDDYLHDMGYCQFFAYMNRREIANRIIGEIAWRSYTKTDIKWRIWNRPIGWSAFDTIHNYVDLNSNIVRKGAISAAKGERVLIPMNMRDGCIIGIGKGNPDWNYSAPHGAGRVMSRAKAKESVSLDEYKASMQGIYSTSIDISTIDESPMAYKPMDEIIKNISDTVEIERIIKPIYNFKAGE